jgi:cyclic pyranopterin phosphate synthase
MVDVGAKAETRRRAVARASLVCRAETAELVRSGGLPKGDALATARVAGVMAAKRTPDLLPLCHPLPLTSARVDIEVCPPADGRAGSAQIVVEATVETVARTGVEMEALTAAAVAALTIYDMAKTVERGMRVTDVYLVEKAGGRSGHWIEGELGGE